MGGGRGELVFIVDEKTKGGAGGWWCGWGTVGMGIPSKGINTSFLLSLLGRERLKK